MQLVPLRGVGGTLNNNYMKKLIFSALVATALCVSSCGKDDDNGGGSTSLNGDWYVQTIYSDYDGTMSWAVPNDCSKRGYRSFSDTQIKMEYYHLERTGCEYTPFYYDYTLSNGEINYSIANNSPNGTKGQKMKSMKYEMKGKELILTFESKSSFKVIEILRKKGVDYSYLDPFVGRWIMTKATVGKTEAIVKEGECLQGTVVSSSIGFTIYLNVPEQNGQCKKTINTYEWVKEGNKYYDVTDPQNKEELAFVFSENNTKLSYSTPSDNGLVTIYLTKVK